MKFPAYLLAASAVAKERDVYHALNTTTANQGLRQHDAETDRSLEEELDLESATIHLASGAKFLRSPALRALASSNDANEIAVDFGSMSTSMIAADATEGKGKSSGKAGSNLQVFQEFEDVQRRLPKRSM